MLGLKLIHVSKRGHLAHWMKPTPYSVSKCIWNIMQCGFLIILSRTDVTSMYRRLNCLLNVCSGAEKRKHQSSASLAFVTGGFSHKGPVTQKIFPFDGVIIIPMHRYAFMGRFYSRFSHDYETGWYLKTSEILFNPNYESENVIDVITSQITCNLNVCSATCIGYQKQHIITLMGWSVMCKFFPCHHDIMAVT